ncbi:uncharacterized protein DEA37_0011288 [Paragonimus westermani]|uniref:Autophagy-related protein 2 n=1 Tax=Paragonimus westermani TaxID=34504 RepID=A0A5J4NNJ1_9TREM|nr:uncharacterized protein DEA37_0011288 [Paragonimus westermani]
MLRKVLSGLIEGVIGSYVEDVNSEKLSIGLLNGNLSLSQLQLKRDTLHRLFDIPLVLEKGTVGRISVRIPYTHLWSQPWQLCIEDVELIAYPSAQDINVHLESSLAGSSDATIAGKGFANDTRYDTQPSAPSTSAPSNVTSSATPYVDPKVYLAEMEEKWWQDNHAEYKLIQIDNLRITWCGSSPNSLYALKTEDDTTLSVQKPVLYVLSPSCLTGHLCRRCTQSSLLRAPAPMQSRLMQIEFNASLGDLKLQLSREFCKATVQLSEFATQEHQLMERFRRRPKCPIFGNITKWWQYAAGEIRPQLRPFFHSTLRAISLATLAAEAKSNVFYVKAYTTYLVRGLTKAKSSSTDAADLTDNSSFLEAVTNDQSVMQKDNENDVFRRKADEDWPVGRIATLRLVAMRQAASKLHRFIERLPTFENGARASCLSNGHTLAVNGELPPRSAMNFSDSPVKDIPPINTEAKQPTQSPSPSSSTMSWYAWWRYSSLLGIRSLWYGPESEVSQSNEAVELPSSSSGSPGDSRPTVKDAVFELLDELAVSSDRWDIPSPVNGGSSGTDLVAFSLVCRVDGFTVRLAEDLADVSTQDHTHPAFLSVSGQRMTFTLDAEPCHRALRFAANVESFTVRDERHQLDKSPTDDAHHISARPTFPFVIFPRITSPKAMAGPPSSGSQLPIEADGKPAANGLFWLIYDVLPPGAEFDYSLEIKTDPLYVVYQPELIRSVSAFVQAVVSVVSPTLESSARQQYEVIKERTQANIRAMLDEPGVHSVQREFASKPLSARKPSRRWRLRLDISAPRLLLPDRLIDYDIDPLSGVRQSHFPLIGLLCDFGHMKVNNWPELDGSEESLLKNTLVSTDNAYSRSDQRDDDELFLTPCGTPTSLSDVDDECDDLRTVNEINRNQFAPNTPVQLKTVLYESYTIHLENLHVLVGELNTLEKLGLWTNPVEERTEIFEVQDVRPEPAREAVSSDLFKFSRTNSRLMSQLCLVDRFNLRLFVSRRITPSYELIKFNCVASQNEIANYPPSLWFTVEQERCVLQLSDVKIDKLLKCLNAHDGDASGTVEPGSDRSDTRKALIARPSLRRSTSCRHAEFSAPKSSNSHPLSNLNFSSQKKRLIATFNVKELIVQLENKGYPVAECRLENAGGTWIRLAGQGAGYQGRIRVSGFSIADAMANLGGDYDLVVASHQRIRLNSVGHLEVLSSEQKPSFPLHDPIFSRLRSCSKPTNDLQPPDGHAAPLLHFNEEATGSDLLRIYFDWMPSMEDTTVQSPGVHYRQLTGIRTLRIHLDRLDVVFNPNTLREISDCLQYLSPLIRPSSGGSKSSSRLDEQPSSRARDVHPSSIITNHFELTLDQLCVLIIRVVCLSSLTCTQADMRSDGVDKVQRADRVVMATLNGLQWLSESANGPVSVDVHFGWEPFLKRVKNQSEQWHLEINGTFTEPTYVHSDETIAELIGWVRSLLIQADLAVEDHGTISHTHSLWPDLLSRANFHLSIRDPIVVFPMDDDLPRSSSHAVIAHFREIFISTVCCAPRSGDPRIHIGLQSAELNTVDLDRFQPPTSVIKTHSVYRYATLWSLESDQKIIDSIISPTSVSIWLSFAFEVNTQLPRWLSSLSELSPMCLISECEFSSHTLQSNDRLETTLESSTVPWSLIEIDVSDLLQIRLTSRVCNQLSRVANILVTRFSQLTSPQSDWTPTKSDRMKMEKMEIDSSQIGNSPSVGLRVHLTALILDMMADLDMYPVPLSSLQLHDIILQVADSRGSKTSGDLTVSSARLLDQLPLEHDKLQRIPATPSALLSVGSSMGLTTTEAPSAIRRTNSCPNLPGATGSGSCEQHHQHSPFLNSITLRLRGVSLDQLAESDRCTRGCRRISEATDNVAARAQFVLLDHERSADLPEQFSKIRQFVLLDCGQLTCRLIPQCWVLLLDFVKFIRFTSTPADPMDSAPVQSTHTDAIACGDSSLIFLMCVDVFQLTLVNCSSRTFDRESMTPCDLAELHASSLKLRVLNYLDQIANHLTGDRQFTPDNFKGPYYSVLCEVSDLMINAKPIQEAMLYEQRLFPRSPESYTAPSMSFQFICSRLGGREFPDEYDAYLWLRLEPTVYTHTQSFLTDVIDSLNAFLQNQDLISRARQSTEGLKVLTSAPLPFRLLLDVVAYEPRMIVPDIIFDCLKHLNVCVEPIGSRYSFGQGHTIMQNNRFKTFPDAADRCLQLRNYLVHPVRRPDGVHVTLFNPVTSVCFQLERNLSNYRSHHAPDWRLVAPLDSIHVKLTKYIYQVIRGLLSYNFGDGGDTAAQLPDRGAISVHRLFNRSKMPFTFTHQPAYYPMKAAIQTSVTGIPWIVASFESHLRNMTFTFFPETEMNSAHEPHTEFRLTRGYFSHVQLSNHCSRTELLSCDLQMFTSQLLTVLQSMASPQPNHIPIILYTPGASVNDDLFSNHPRDKPEVCRFMFQFNSAPYSATISLYACAMSIQYDHRALTHVTDLLTAPAIGSQSENLSNTSVKFPLNYQMCLENSKIVLMEHLHHPSSNTITVQMTLREDQLLLEDQIPSFTRLVIEVVRTGSSLQHSIVLRSGLTVTNDLPDGHQLLVGLQLAPPRAVDTPTSSPDVEDVWSTHLASDQSVQHIPLLLVESGRTASVPLNLVAASSTGLGLLCFRPTLIPRSSRLSVAAVYRQPDGPRYTSYDWAAVCLPDTLLTEDSSTAESSFRRGDSASSVAQPIELSKSDAIKYMDWTRLKLPGELIEANLICRTASSQVGLISATLDSGNNISRTGDSKPVFTGSHGVIGLPVTAIPHRTHRSRSLPPPQYNMGLVIVRDQFPPDPLWIGLPDRSTDRLHPKCLPGHHVTVGPLIRITNLLPCELNYFFEGTAVTGTLRASEDACVHEVSLFVYRNILALLT